MALKNKSLVYYFIFTLLMGVFYRDFSYLSVPAPMPGGRLYITELTIGLFFIIGYLKLSVIKRLRDWILLEKKIILLYLWFSASSIIAILYSDWSSIGLLLREFASYYYSVFFFLPVFLIKNTKRMDLFIKIILLASILALLLILVRFAMGIGHINSTGQLRYGNYETVGILILIGWLFLKPLRQWNIFYWAVFLASLLIVLILINHRSSLISVLAVILIATYLNDKQNTMAVVKKVWVIASVFGVLSIPFIMINHDLFFSAIDRLLTTFTPTREINSSWRIFTWKIILSDMSIVDMLIGKGWGWQIPVFKFNSRIYGDDELIRGFHNSSLFYFYHLGFFGLTAFACFIIGVYKNAMVSLAGQARPIKNKINSLISANIGIYVFSMFNVVFEGPYMSFFFWTTLGIIYHYPILYKNQNGGPILEG